MYCPSCGKAVAVNSKICSNCEYNINPKLFSFEPEKTERDLKELDFKNNRIYAFLAYLGPLVLISVIKAKKSAFAHFHSNQGLLVCLMYALSVLMFFVPNIGKALGFLLIILSLTFSIVGILNVFKNSCKELPLIGKFKILK